MAKELSQDLNQPINAAELRDALLDVIAFGAENAATLTFTNWQPDAQAKNGLTVEASREANLKLGNASRFRVTVERLG